MKTVPARRAASHSLSCPDNAGDDGRIDRRTFLKLVGMAGSAAAMDALASRPKAGGKHALFAWRPCDARSVGV